jgi:hypothetical protein
LRTDQVVVRHVIDPHVGSGIFAIFAKVSGTTEPTRPRRDYFILYMGEGQTLPAVGLHCEISYRWGHRAESLTRGRIVERFSCNDGRHWPDE